VLFSGFIPSAIGFRQTRQDVLSELKRSVRHRQDLYSSERVFDTLFQVLSWLIDQPGSIPDKYRKLLPHEQVTTSVFDTLLNLPAAEIRDLLSDYVDANFKPVEWVKSSTFGYGAGDQHTGSSRRFPPLSARHHRAATTIGFGAEAVRGLQGSIRYLGPLREEPQVVSPTGARYRALPAGIKGEYTADLLARSKESVIKYHDWNNRSRRDPLPVALTRWVSHLGLGDEVTVKDQGKLGRGLRMQVNGVARDLTTIGVGASQLLPVLTVVLTAASGNVILLEQPELHLHPLVQSRLADFFLYARADVKLVVESHSEYMVTRIRRRVVEHPQLQSRVAVLFAEQHRGVTELRRLYLDRLGNFSDWPRGFFDTQDTESAELAHAVRDAIKAGNSE
jgi:predicted ATPase